ncbi:hypothetical protein [Streptomyces pseudogriseolus]|uniref:hypothetical protein n=1 Tax=Streptomyces pseudogriseolus TaxID=36817 RepID=UPI003FA22BFD
MDVAPQYAQQCSELYAAGGFAAVRRTAQAGLDQVGPTAVLYRWLGQAHAAEDEDDHDAEAERAYRSGLALAPDDLGLLVCYLELCLRADAFDYPVRAGRVATLRARIDELAPAGSPESRRVDDALSWAGRGYWDDLIAAAGRGELQQAESAELSERVAGALRAGTVDAASPATAAEDMREAELAAALELLQGRANAPLRYLVTHRTAAYVITCAAALGVNRLLVTTGVVTFSAWGTTPRAVAPLRNTGAVLERTDRQEVCRRVPGCVDAATVPEPSAQEPLTGSGCLRRLPARRALERCSTRRHVQDRAMPRTLRRGTDNAERLGCVRPLARVMPDGYQRSRKRSWTGCRCRTEAVGARTSSH